LGTAAHERLCRFWGKWFHLTAEQLDALNFSGMALCKLGVMLLNLAPLAAVYLVE
jgi:hypothetical protein